MAHTTAKQPVHTDATWSKPCHPLPSVRVLAATAAAVASFIMIEKLSTTHSTLQTHKGVSCKVSVVWCVCNTQSS